MQALCFYFSRILLSVLLNWFQGIAHISFHCYISITMYVLCKSVNHTSSLQSPKYNNKNSVDPLPFPRTIIWKYCTIFKNIHGNRYTCISCQNNIHILLMSLDLYNYSVIQQLFCISTSVCHIHNYFTCMKTLDSTYGRNNCYA